MCTDGYIARVVRLSMTSTYNSKPRMYILCLSGNVSKVGKKSGLYSGLFFPFWTVIFFAFDASARFSPNRSFSKFSTNASRRKSKLPPSLGTSGRTPHTTAESASQGPKCNIFSDLQKDAVIRYLLASYIPRYPNQGTRNIHPLPSGAHFFTSIRMISVCILYTSDIKQGLNH